MIITAATNRPDILDPALLRPGRFDRRVTVDAPDVRGREAILRVHTRGKPLKPDTDLAVIARQTPGFTGADIENLVNEAALLRPGGKKVNRHAELEEGIMRVIAGPEQKSRLVSEKEKAITTPTTRWGTRSSVTSSSTPTRCILVQGLEILVFDGLQVHFDPEQNLFEELVVDSIFFD